MPVKAYPFLMDDMSAAITGNLQLIRLEHIDSAKTDTFDRNASSYIFTQVPCLHKYSSGPCLCLSSQ